MGWKSHCPCQHHVFLGRLSLNSFRLVDWVEASDVGEGKRRHDFSYFCPTSVAKVGLSRERREFIILMHSIRMRVGHTWLSEWATHYLACGWCRVNQRWSDDVNVL